MSETGGNALPEPPYWQEAETVLAAKDPVMRRLIASVGRSYPARRGEPFGTLVRAIVGQQLSVRAAETIWQRFQGMCPVCSPEAVIQIDGARFQACGFSRRKAEYVRDLGFTPEQVQDFYPTPSTLSTCMYYTGIHPLTGEKVYVPKNPHEKAIQRALMQYKNPANRELVLEGLKMTGRMDLVGYGPKCLIRPLRENHGGQQHTQGSSRNAKNSRNSKNNKNSSASAKKNTIRNIHKKNSRGGRK